VGENDSGKVDDTDPRDRESFTVNKEIVFWPESTGRPSATAKSTASMQTLITSRLEFAVVNVTNFLYVQVRVMVDGSWTYSDVDRFDLSSINESIVLATIGSWLANASRRVAESQL